MLQAFNFKKKDSVLLVAASYFSFFSTLFVPFIHVDEGGAATWAHYAFSGDLYANYPDHKFPFLFQFFWLLTLGAKSMIALRWILPLWMAFGGILFKNILERWFSSETAFFTALIFCICSSHIGYGAFAAERAFIVFTFLGTWSAIRLYEKAPSFHAIVCGFCFAAAAGLKAPAIFLGIPAFLFLCRTSKPFLNIFISFVSAVGFTVVSFLLTRVDWNIIFNEALFSNLTYVKTHSSLNTLEAHEVLKNVGVVLGGAYPLLFVMALAGFVYSLNRISKNNLKKYLWPLALIVSAVVGTLMYIKMGSRFYQPYFISLLPVLCLGFAFAKENFLNGKRFKLFLISSILLTLGWNIFFLQMQLRDENKNWNSHIRHLIDEIKHDSAPEEKIWILMALHSVYFMSERDPAVKYIFFQHVINHVDPCRVDPSTLKEPTDNPKYEEHLSLLQKNRPKVIFWSQRHSNSCADNVKLENYPRLQEYINQNYSLKWESPIGKYYLLKEN